MSHFPLNAWYAVVCDGGLRRALLPLSLGRLDGDEVVYGDHGVVFNAEGRCTQMPSQETLDPSFVHGGSIGDRAVAGSGARPAGDNAGDRSCHCFRAFARNDCLNGQRITHALREGVAGIFRDDEAVLEAQQRTIALRRAA